MATKHLNSIFKEMPASLKKVTFEQIFIDNSQLSQYVKEFIDENRGKIQPKTLNTRDENLKEIKSAGTMTIENVYYDQNVQTDLDQKDQYIQHEVFSKEQFAQAEYDHKEQFIQTDQFENKALESPLDVKSTISPNIKDSHSSKSKNVKAKSKAVSKKKTSKKTAVPPTSSDSEVANSIPLKRTSLASVDIPIKKKRTDETQKKPAPRTYSRRAALLKKK
eukprot:NODE_4_length_77007_cov_1.156642.p49 type:complete len:220 gc:universal NODE_4_length_77007_cov_1.156642:65106-64447(-)